MKKKIKSILVLCLFSFILPSCDKPQSLKIKFQDSLTQYHAYDIDISKLNDKATLSLKDTNITKLKNEKLYTNTSKKANLIVKNKNTYSSDTSDIGTAKIGHDPPQEYTAPNL